MGPRSTGGRQTSSRAKWAKPKDPSGMCQVQGQLRRRIPSSSSSSVRSNSILGSKLRAQLNALFVCAIRAVDRASSLPDVTNVQGSR